MKEIHPFQVFTEEVIISTKSNRGTGKNELSPVRVITEVFTKSGEKIAEYDPCKDANTFVATDLIHFHLWCKKNIPTIEPTEEHILDWLNSIK